MLTRLGILDNTPGHEFKRPSRLTVPKVGKRSVKPSLSARLVRFQGGAHDR